MAMKCILVAIIMTVVLIPPAASRRILEQPKDESTDQTQQPSTGDNTGDKFGKDEFDWAVFLRPEFYAPQTPGDRPNDCFPPESTVITLAGPKRMDQLRVGDRVLDSNSAWTEVAAFFHAHKNVHSSTYIRVQIDDTRSLLISPNHIIFRRKPDDDSNVQEEVNASELQIGDVLFLTNGTGRVTQLHSVVRRGAYAPLTLSGTVLVDGVWVSCFASSDSFGPKTWGQSLTQTYYLAPLRFMYQAAKVFGVEKLLQGSLFQPSGEGEMLWYARMALWMIS